MSAFSVLHAWRMREEKAWLDKATEDALNKLAAERHGENAPRITITTAGESPHERFVSAVDAAIARTLLGQAGATAVVQIRRRIDPTNPPWQTELVVAHESRWRGRVPRHLWGPGRRPLWNPRPRRKARGKRKHIRRVKAAARRRS